MATFPALGKLAIDGMWEWHFELGEMFAAVAVEGTQSNEFDRQYIFYLFCDLFAAV